MEFWSCFLWLIQSCTGILILHSTPHLFCIEVQSNLSLTMTNDHRPKWFLWTGGHSGQVIIWLLRIALNKETLSVLSCQLYSAFECRLHLNVLFCLCISPSYITKTRLILTRCEGVGFNQVVSLIAGCLCFKVSGELDIVMKCEVLSIILVILLC